MVVTHQVIFSELPKSTDFIKRIFRAKQNLITTSRR
jgi:hypothetical protein